MLKKLKTKTGMLITLGVVFTLVLGLSYATFIFTTGNYRSTELLIGKLNYGIDIKEDGSTSKISANGKAIAIPANTKAYFIVTITSLNPVDSKYALAYKANNTSVTVNYTDRTSWNSTGFIKGYDDNTYSKKVRIVVNNPTTLRRAVNLAVYGGYSFNTIEAINIGNGYKVIPGGYTETDSLQIFDLTTLIEKENDCTATETTPCLYGGENERNYVQYPETTNKSENIWRILGTYSIESSSLPKLISTKTSTSTTSSLTTDLTTFYNNLTDTDTFVYGTNKFNCTSSGCTSNTYTNIGLLTEYEYNLIGGLNSYLSSLNPFFIQGSSSVLEATSSGIKTSTSSNLRPVIYLKNNVQVQGSGTASDPYILVPTSDINIVAYTLNGQTTTKKYEELLKYNLVNKITCENGSIAEWDNETASIKLTSVKAPDYCTIDFKDGFTVSLSAGTTGTVSAPVSQSIGYNGSVSFTVTSNTGSTELTKNTCNGVLSGNTFTISNVKESKNCEIEFSKPTLANKLLIDNEVETAPRGGAYNTVFTEETTGVIFQSTESIDDDTYDVYYFAGDISNNWVKFGTYQTDDPDGKWSAGDDIYWRIIRTNADGSVRLLYSGTSPDTTEGYIGKSAFNVIPSGISSRPRFMSYMYGDDDDLDSTLDGIKANTKDSTIKTYIDNWYNTYFSSYTRYLSTEAVYCNDRQLSNGQTWTFPSSNQINFAAYTRLDWENKGVNANPTYDCVDSKDAFSVENENAKLTYPIGLMTADEVNMAGGLAGNAAEAWYYFNSDYDSIIGNNEDSYCTMTPSIWSGRSANIWGVDSVTDNLGALGVFGYSDTEFVVRPVISLKRNMVWKDGDGTPESPYEVEDYYRVNVTLSVINGSGDAIKTVESGSSVSFIVTPSEGYDLELSANTCGGTLSGNTYTLSEVTSDKSCSITFKKLTHNVTLSVINGSGSTTKAVEPGSSVSFTVTPSYGYKRELSTNTCGGTLSGNTYTVNNITSNKNCEITFKIDVPPEGSNLLAAIKYYNPTISTRTDFSTTFTTTNTGTLYKATESIAGSTAKDVYYFAGDTKYNWVKFGKWETDLVIYRGYYPSSISYKEYLTMNECTSDPSYNTNCKAVKFATAGDPIYWRIIRTNSDGSIRLLYSGTRPGTTEGHIGLSAFNSTNDDPMYVGYKYGTSGSLINNRTNTNNSTIKTYVDNWYSTNLSSYTKYISTEAVYCNDREVGSGKYSVANSQFFYAPYTRISTNKVPSYNCTNSKDAFSGSNSEAKLTYPIGLMTVDEIVYAGGKVEVSLTSPYAWYYSNRYGKSITGDNYWWSLSPMYWAGNSNRMWYVGGSNLRGGLTSGYLPFVYGVRPVISIKGDALWSSGNGSPDNPYEIAYN